MACLFSPAARAFVIHLRVRLRRWFRKRTRLTQSRSQGLRTRTELKIDEFTKECRLRGNSLAALLFLLRE